MMAATRTLLPEPNTTRLSSVLIAAVVGGGLWLLAVATGTYEPTLIASLAGGLLGTTLFIHDIDSPVGRTVAVFFLPVTGFVGLLAVGVPLRNVLEMIGQQPVARSLVGQLGVTIAAVMATFGIVGTQHRQIGSGAVTRLWRTAVLAWFGTGTAFGALLIMQSDALTAIGLPAVGGLILTDLIFRPAEPLHTLITFWVVAVLFVSTLKLLLNVAPIVELTPQTSHQRITRAMSRINSVLNWSFALLMGATVLLVGLAVFAVDLRRFAVVLALLGSTGLRYVMVVGICGMFGSALLIIALQLVTGRVTKTLGWFVPSLVSGVGSVLVAIGGSPVVADATTEFPQTSLLPVEAIVNALTPPGVVLAGLTLVVGVFTGFLALIVVAGGMRYIPQRSAGSAIASGSLGFGAIAAGVYGGHSLIIFSVVGLSIVAWSIGDQNTAMRAELGESSVQLEAIQTLSGLGLAAVGVLLAWTLSTAVFQHLVVSNGTLVGVVTTVTGVLILMLALRG